MRVFDDPREAAWWAKDHAHGEFSALYLAQGQDWDSAPRLLRIGLSRSEWNTSGWGWGFRF